MPNIHGTYTLTEAAHEIGVTSAFINRIQKETGIGGEIGTKGRLAAFSKDDVEVFKRIKILRMLGFRFKDIKEIWETESALMKMWRHNVIDKYLDLEEPSIGNYETKHFPLIIHNEFFELRFNDMINQKSKDAKETEAIKQFQAIATKMLVFSDAIAKRMETVRDIQERLLEREDPRLLHLKDVFRFWVTKEKA
jgi:DNA-binding transcriptional MerR regulator